MYLELLGESLIGLATRTRHDTRDLRREGKWEVRSKGVQRLLCHGRPLAIAPWKERRDTGMCVLDIMLVPSCTCVFHSRIGLLLLSLLWFSSLLYP